MLSQGVVGYSTRGLGVAPGEERPISPLLRDYDESRQKERLRVVGTHVTLSTFVHTGSLCTREGRREMCA